LSSSNETREADLSTRLSAFVRNLSKKRNAQYVTLTLIATLIIVFLYQNYSKAYKPNGTDFTSYLLSADALKNGESPYEPVTPFKYIYPMFLAMALIPMTFLPKWLVHGLWSLINWSALFATFVMLMRLSLHRIERRPWLEYVIPIAAVLFLHVGVLQDQFRTGQVNLFVLFFCALFLYCEQTGKSWQAALSLAIAGAIKLTPLFFIVYLMVRRRFGLVALVLLFFAFLCFLPVIFLGSDIIPIYAKYINGFIHKSLTHPTESHEIFFNLPTLVQRYLPILQWISVVPMVVMFFATAAIAGIDWIFYRRHNEQVSGWTLHLYLLGILLITPRSELHHYTLMLPTAALVFLVWVYVAQKNQHLLLLVLMYICGFLTARFFGGPFFVVALMTLVVAVHGITRYLAKDIHQFPCERRPPLSARS
jgi:alpha-1,2-mannosyltransferase